jgi:DNA-binding transcriptional LysR family regulator
LKAQFITHNISTLVSMVRQGLGMGIVSSLSLSTFPHDLTVKETMPLITREIGIAVPSLPDASLAVQLLVRTAQELFVNVET